MQYFNLGDLLYNFLMFLFPLTAFKNILHTCCYMLWLILKYVSQTFLIALYALSQVPILYAYTGNIDTLFQMHKCSHSVWTVSTELKTLRQSAMKFDLSFTR